MDINQCKYNAALDGGAPLLVELRRHRAAELPLKANGLFS